MIYNIAEWMKLIWAANMPHKIGFICLDTHDADVCKLLKYSYDPWVSFEYCTKSLAFLETELWPFCETYGNLLIFIFNYNVKLN